jgi:hypothetical protein
MKKADLQDKNLSLQSAFLNYILLLVPSHKFRMVCEKNEKKQKGTPAIIDCNYK